MTLYEEVNTGEAVDDGRISAGFGVGGKNDRGGQTGFGGDGDEGRSVYAGRIPGSPET